MNERGAIMAFFLVLSVALLLCAGLVVDGGTMLVERRQAFTEADEAARAGAQTLAPPALHGGVVAIDSSAATTAAQSYLQRTGHTGQVTVSGAQVLVTVQIPQHLFLLSIAGLGDREVRGSSVAEAVRGVESKDAL